MDYGSIIIIAGIVLYTIKEYRKRERFHAQHLEYLDRNEVPPEQKKTTAEWKLATTGIVCLLLLIFIIAFTIFVYNTDAQVALIIALLHLPIAILLILIFVRDYKMSRKQKTQKEE